MGMMCWTHATGEDLNFYGLTAQYHTLWLMSLETEERGKCRQNSKSLLAGRLDQIRTVLRYGDSAVFNKIICNLMRLKLKNKKIPS